MLEPSDIEAIASRVAQLVEVPTPFVTVAELAEHLRVDESWIYENRVRLGGVKLGPGRGAPIRFDLVAVHKLVAAGALEREPARGRARRETQLPAGVSPIGRRALSA